MQNETMKKYTRIQVYDETLKYFKGDTLATDVWIDKYCLKDSNGNYFELTPNDMHRRLAKELARIESKYPNALSENEIFDLLKDFKYIIPQGSPMSGIGNDFQVSSLSNCFVVGTKFDSYGAVLKTDQEIVQLSKRRAGIGTTLEYIRPKDTVVNNAAMTSTGVVPFMERYSNSIREVAQCLYEDSLILTKTGMKYIKDVNIGEKVWTKTGWVSVNNVLKNKKSLIKVTTKFGNEIICSEDHVFQSKKQEKQIKEFNIGDTINIIVGKGYEGVIPKLITTDYVKSDYNNSNRLNTNFTLPEVIDEKLAYILGYSYGDGYVDESHMSLAMSNDWQSIKDKIKVYVKDVFDCEIKVKDGDGNLEKYEIHSKYILNHLRNNNILKQKAKDIIFPELLYNADSKIVFSFISGFFDADGSVNRTKKSFKISSINKEFLLYIQRFFYANGIISKIHHTDRSHIPNWSDIYEITINGRKSQTIFKKCMSESCKITERGQFDKNKDNTVSIYTIKDFNSISTKHLYLMDNYQYLSYNILDRVVEDLDFKDFEPLLFQDYVIKKEVYNNGDLTSVVDLSLDSEHLFSANGIYAHNCGRRGALLLSTHIKSMDSEDFISAKIDLKKVTGANISIKIDDEFMKSLSTDNKYTQQYPIDSLNPLQSKVIDSKKIWDKLIQNNHKSAEPGILFWSTILKESLPDCYSDIGFETIGLNPCGEITLCDADSCRLLCINLYSYAENPFTPQAKFNYELLAKHAQIAQKFMDDIVDLELEKIETILTKIDSDPEDEDTKMIERNLWLRIKDKCIKGRRSGLGITAEGDMLAAMNLKYGTKEATEFSTNVHKILSVNSYKSSAFMARDRGIFTIYDRNREVNNPFLNRLFEADSELKELVLKYGRRNIANLTLAPTGSVSILTQTTSGIEPLFLPYYKRRKKVNNKSDKVAFTDVIGDTWEEYYVIHEKLKVFADVNNYELNDDTIEDIFKKSPYYGATSNDVNWEENVRMQGSIQQYIDHSISKTVNLPNNISVDMVDKIYKLAWEVGCKGITIYRDGSRDGVLVSNDKKDDAKLLEYLIKDNNAPKRPKTLECDVLRFTNNNEKWISCVGLIKNGTELRPYEIFTGKMEDFIIPAYVTKGTIIKNKTEDGTKQYDFSYVDKHGYKVVMEGISRSFDEQYWNYAKFISALLRHGMPIKSIVDLIDSLKLDTDLINTWKKGIQRILKTYVKDDKVSGKKCPECGEESLVFENGCMICKSCGNSRC